MNPYVLKSEFCRVWRYCREIMISQGLSVLVVGIFSFMLRDLLPLYPQIGSCFYWLAQSFSILFLGDRLFQRDLLQGFFSNVLNSQTSLSSFLVSRWFAFTLGITVYMALMAPLLLYLLRIPSERWGYFLLLLLPFNGMVGGYSGMLSLLTQGAKSYLLPLLLLPLLLPTFIFTVGGVFDHNFMTVFAMLMAILFLTLPFIIGVSVSVLHHLIQSY